MEEIKKHPFFSQINWIELHNSTPPFVPQLEDEYDTSCFPNEQQFEGFKLDGETDKKLEVEDPFIEWDWSQKEKETK